jgi:D-serine deaminase-like pyridoxal phosphate-dependent protein
MSYPNAATIDSAAVTALADIRVSWADKGWPPKTWGQPVRAIAAAGLRLSDFPTPLLTLSAPGMQNNLRVLADWCSERGLDLAPHGKTTMAPQLWSDQLDSGAWAITLANLPQLAVARAFGVSRVMIANAIISPLTLRWIADELAADDGFRLLTWADSIRTVELMESALAEHATAGPAAAEQAKGRGYRPVDVLVEVGGAGGRTGAREIETAVAIGRAIAAAPHLRLAGVAGYEGALSHGTDAASLAVVRGYLESLSEVHRTLVAEAAYPDGVQPVVTAGGSAYFDVVADVLATLVGDGVRVVLRSGAYLAHDDGFYSHISPLGEQPRTGGPVLHSAMHGWVRISSQPEPGLALFDAGKRDLPFDEGLPRVQLRRGRAAGESPVPLAGVAGLSVTALNDQHGFLRYEPSASAPVQIGDELRLGLSHPCTAFDKWRLIPVIDDPDAADPVVVDLIRTYF